MAINHFTKTVTTATTEILAANPSRIYALIQNDSDTVQYLAFGTDAVANTGVRLAVNGSFEMGRHTNNLNGLAINGINGTGSKVVCGIELDDK